MRISKYILTILVWINPIILFGSCHGEYFSITELLNHDPKNHHIFTCEILKTYIREHSYESIAVVKRRFKGNPNDTIFINSGGGTTAGGQKLYPNSEWLIFSTTQDNLHYGATVCDFLSTKISKGSNTECARNLSPLGRVYIEFLKKYELIKRNKYSGYKEINVGGNTIAEGNFINGLPNGDWIHYSKRDEFEKGIRRSEISYQNGMLHGEYHIYHEVKDQNIIIEKRRYKSNLPVSIEYYGQYKKRYEYVSAHERMVISTFTDSSGVQLKEANLVELDYNSEIYNSIRFRHGYYFNKSGTDSSKFSPLAEGNYFRGARIGEWKFFNKRGELIATKIYPDSLADVAQFQIYDEEGSIKLSGLYVDGKRMGTWKHFYDNRLDYEVVYNSNGDRMSKTHFYNSGRVEFIPYHNNLEHGRKINFSENMTVKSIESYTNGRLNGISIFFNKDGTIRKESKFINSREFTINRTENNGYVSNEFLNGHVVQYNHRTGEKMHEGDYWNGYRVGVWIEYGKNDSYSKLYYPTDKEELMNQCSHSMPKLIEQYDKEGNLLNSKKY